MKTRGTIAVACALSLALFGCGGNGAPANNGGSGGQTTEQTQVVATPVGTWKVAAVEMEGITMTGDIAEFAKVFGADDSSAEMINMAIDLQEGGKGTISAGTEKHDITWKEEAGKITLSGTGESASNMTGTFKDGVITIAVEENGPSVIMTPDGTYADAKTFDRTGAKPVTSESELSGTWKMVGLNMMGLSMYGESDALAKVFGFDAATLTFNAGGKANLFGEETTYTVDANGTKIANSDASGVQIDVLSLDGNLIVDMGAAMGGVDMFLVMGK